MQKKPLNLLSFNTPFFLNANHNHRSKKMNNKFKKSSTAQYSTKTKEIKLNSHYHPDAPIGINNINNNIYLNLFNKFNNNNHSNTSSLKLNMISPKEIISNRINYNQMIKKRKNLNSYEIHSSSSFKKQSNLTNSMNVISNKGHINIRLNIKNQFKNNNNMNNNYKGSISDNNINYELNFAEKMKEKDMKIIQLQNDLLKSQEIINGLNNNININNSFKYNKNQNNIINNYNKNLNKSSREKNFFILTKSSESIDRILKTAFNEHNLNNKKQNKRIHKNNFLKKTGNDFDKKRINNSNKKNKNIKINESLYTTYNIKTKRQKKYDYLKLLLPISHFLNIKPRFNSYSNDRKNIKNKINFNLNNNDKNKIEKVKINNFVINSDKNNMKNNFSDFTKKCENLKKRANELINNYINLANSFIE